MSNPCITTSTLKAAPLDGKWEEIVEIMVEPEVGSGSWKWGNEARKSFHKNYKLKKLI